MTHRAFDGYVTNQTTNGVDGYNTVIRGQNATGTGSKGGNVIFQPGTGTSSDGYVSFRSAAGVEVMRVASTGFKDVTVDGYLHTIGNTVLDGYLWSKGPYSKFDGYIRTDGYLLVDGYTYVDGYEVFFDGYAQAPFFRQIDMPTPGVDGYTMTIRSQRSTTSPAHGGNLALVGGDGYNGDGYNRDGYVQLFSGSTEIIRIAVGKQIHLAGERFKITAVATSPYNVLVTDMNLMVDTTSARTINLPTNPALGDAYRVKDSTGTAATNNITVQGNGKNIEGSASNVINTNFGKAAYVYNGTQWVIF